MENPTDSRLHQDVSGDVSGGAPENVPKNSSDNNSAKKPEKKKQSVAKVTIFVALISLGIGLFFGYNERYIEAALSNIMGQKMSTAELDLSNVQYTYQKLVANYDGELDDEKLIQGASRGLVEAVGDDYTVFLDAEEAEEFNNDLQGSIGGGIGAELFSKDGNVTIANVLDGTPALKAGLKAGDVIASVNDENVLGQSTENVVKKVRGEVGTTVKLNIIRDGKSQEFNVTREIISVPSVKSETKDDGTLILSVSRFDQDTAKLMRQAVQTQKDKNNLKGIVVDLRNNGGGFLESAVKAAGIWLNNKEVVVEKAGNEVIDKRSTGSDAIANNVPTIILANEATASASEILAGALRDHGAAKIVGAKTFGKGSVQSMFSLPNNNQLKVTIARWYTPKGVNISKQGLKPDVEIVLEDQRAENANDNQLDEAIKLLYDGR